MDRILQALMANGWRRFGGVLALLCALLGPAARGEAATGAGARIVNVAGLQFDEAGQAMRISSNAVTLTVDELLDVAITTPVDRIAAGIEGDTPVPFTVSNLGNAAESFAIAASADRAGATVAAIVADTNDDGVYDAAVDQPLTGSEIPLAAGQSRRLFVLVRGAGGEPVTVTATAAATTGSGEPGSAYPGAGEGAVDAVVGRTGGTASASVRIAPAGEAPSLAKSQSVLASDGSSRVVSGSIVTYRLDARFPEATPAAEIVDKVPRGTRFVPGSIRVDGRPASDATDNDAAAFDGTAVRVALGDIAAASTRSIQFDVQIQ